MQLSSMLSVEKLVSVPWTFSPAGDMLMESNFRFAASGEVEVHRNDNEHRWLVEDGRLRVLRSNGSLMWESAGVSLSGEGAGTGLEIAVTSPLDAGLHFVFRECGSDGRVILDRKATLSAARFLFPDDLQVTPSDVRRVLIIGSCLSERFLEFTRQDRQDVAFDFILFNYAGELPSSLPAPASEYDFQYIQIPLRSVVTDRVIHAVQLNSAEFVEGVLADGRAIIDAMLDSALVYTREHGLPAFVSNFLVPQTNLAASVRQRGTRHDLGHIVTRFNEYMAEAIQRHPNTYLCDIDTLAGSFGKRFFLDDVVAFSAHGSILHQERYDMQPHARIERVPEMNTFYETRWREFFQALFEQAVATLRTIRQMDQVKAVVFDLDHTLWRGQIAEDYRSDAESFPPHSEWQLGLWDAVHHLRARGILVAICSKNDLATVKENWGNVVHPPFIALEDFAVVKINWSPKSENIREICADFNIKPRSVVFVDDNPIEREAVRAALPDVRVIGSNPYLTRRILLWSPETQIAHLSAESAGREEAIRGQIVREDTRTSLSRAEFLQTLGCEVTFLAVRDAGQAEFARALELTNKTNQFNTTGLRWTAAGLQEFLRDGGEVLGFRVKDRFAEYGLVGVVYGKDGLVVQMVMSCRVLGMEIEQCAVARVVEGMAARDPSGPVTAQLLETPDNGPCREVFPRLGFEEGERDGDMRCFALDSSRSVAMPSHITVLNEELTVLSSSLGLNINLVFDGDSIALGVGASPEMTLAKQVGRLLKGHNTLHVVAQDGRQLRQCLDTFETHTALLHNSEAIRNIVFIKAGDNDITERHTAEETYEKLKKYAYLAHQKGWEIIIASNLQRYDISEILQIELEKFNDLLISNDYYADHIVDFAKDPVLGGSDVRNNLEYYNLDGVHPADSGYSILANLICEIINE